MEKCIYLPVKALSRKRYGPIGPGEVDEEQEVLPEKGENISISLNGKVTEIKNGLAKIENLVSDGFAIEWPGEGSKSDDKSDDGEEGQTENKMREEAAKSEAPIY